MGAIKKQVASAFKNKNEFFLASSLERTGEWKVQEGKVVIPCGDSFLALKVEEAAGEIKASVAGITGQQLEVEIQKPKSDVSSEQGSGTGQTSPEVELVKKVFKGEIV